jgi:ribosomal protein L30E
VGIFVRELGPQTETLIQQIDQEVAAHKDDKLAAFVVLLSENPGEQKSKLKQIASEKKIQHVPLTVYEGTDSPLGYNVKQEAAVNVMLWEGVVKANRAFRTGELDQSGIQEVIEDTRLMVN